MKKIYLQPSVKMAKTEIELILDGSGVMSDKGIGYGGADTNGSKDPASRQRHSVWDDENDEEF